MLPAGPLHRMRIGSLHAAPRGPVERQSGQRAQAGRRRRAEGDVRGASACAHCSASSVHVASLARRPAVNSNSLGPSQPPGVVKGIKRSRISPQAASAARRVELAEDLQDRARRAANEVEVVVDRGQAEHRIDRASSRRRETRLLEQGVDAARLAQAEQPARMKGSRAGRPACFNAVDIRIVTHGFFSGRENTIVHTPPPGPQRAMHLAQPRSGSGKNISPSRHTAASNEASGTPRSSPSATRVSTWASRRERRCRAPGRRSPARGRSQAHGRADPPAARWRASGRRTPAATSSTRAPGLHAGHAAHGVGRPAQPGAGCPARERSSLQRRRSTGRAYSP